jgi:DNA-binding NtrC family response regulator
MRGTLSLEVFLMGHILIVSDNAHERRMLEVAFRNAGFISQAVDNIEAACQLAKSGHFQVVFSAPKLADGSWMRLIDFSNRRGLGFEVVLVARTFNLNQWAEALERGAFDVLDVLYDLPKADVVAKRALEAAYANQSQLHTQASPQA